LKIILLALTILLSLSARDINNYINKKNCDQIINKQIYSICYSYRYKGALGGWTTLEGDKVNTVNIKKRPRFYNEKTIPMRYRTKYKNYTHSGYDRGHTIISDADCDYSKKSLIKSYSMANITPQAPLVNRRTWIKVERYGRLLATKLGYINSITIVNYNKSNKKINNNITIPTGYYRIYYNNKANFERCFYYRNNINVNWRQDRLKNHLVDCNRINNFNEN